MSLYDTNLERGVGKGMVAMMSLALKEANAEERGKSAKCLGKVDFITECSLVTVVSGSLQVHCRAAGGRLGQINFNSLPCSVIQHLYWKGIL